jgi:aryl-alcohol dehydrogenase-like predicted oxidoreductase
MEYKELGRTGLKVSRLCFGALTIGPLQADLPLDEGVALLKYAAEQGVNFFDTAEIYDSYDYLRLLLRALPNKDIIIATNSFATMTKASR